MDASAAAAGTATTIPAAPAPAPAPPAPPAPRNDRKKAKLGNAALAGKKRGASSSDGEVSSYNSQFLLAKSATKPSNSVNRKKKETKLLKNILLDSGANVSCLSKPTYFDKLNQSNSSKTGSISIATGDNSAIQGSGSIGNCPAKFTPNFDYSLAPM